MVIVQICVGSSCHLKGAPELVAMLKKEIADNKLDDEIALSGSFCFGKCNRVGVTIAVNDDIYAGITPESFHQFWLEKILPAVKADTAGDQEV